MGTGLSRVLQLDPRMQSGKPIPLVFRFALLVLALIVEHGTDRAVLTVVAALALIAFACFVALRLPGGRA